MGYSPSHNKARIANLVNFLKMAGVAGVPPLSRCPSTDDAKEIALHMAVAAQAIVYHPISERFTGWLTRLASEITALSAAIVQEAHAKFINHLQSKGYPFVISSISWGPTGHPCSSPRVCLSFPESHIYLMLGYGAHNGFGGPPQTTCGWWIRASLPKTEHYIVAHSDASVVTNELPALLVEHLKGTCGEASSFREIIADLSTQLGVTPPTPFTFSNNLF